MFVLYGLLGVLAVSVVLLVIYIKKEKAREAVEQEQHQQEITALQKEHQQELSALREEHQRHIEDLQEEYDSRIASIRDAHLVELRKVREHIEERKEVLSAMEDRELLVNIMIALESYAGRMERLEEALRGNEIVNYNSEIMKSAEAEIYGMVHSITEKMRQIEAAASSGVFSGQLSHLQSIVDSLSAALSNMKKAVDEIHKQVTSPYLYDTLANTVFSINSTVDDIRSAQE